MLPTTPLGILLTGQLVFFAVAFSLATIMVIIQTWLPHSRRLINYLGVCLIFSFTAFLTYSIIPSLISVSIFMVIALGLVLALIPLFPELSPVSRTFLVINYALMTSSVIYTTWLLFTLPLSHTTQFFMLLSLPFILVSLPSVFIQRYELFEAILRRTWSRPHSILPHPPPGFTPKVSLHLPCHAEPPNLVIETLNHLNQLYYSNFEVLVIDNNTPDPQLWRPVETHCTKLGSRFRFFTVQNLTGAKAGALNYALKNTSPDAQIIAVIDADYHVDPDFIDHLIGYFKDPQIGFVQTPHDYRDWQDNHYLNMCYWEYQLFFHSVMVSLNERHAGITVGTMCLVRREALETAGGWSEWCLTEDSELAIRIHALGYTSVYTTTSTGWGLIPETFSGYKKQRFRWTVGPIQEFKHHWPLLIPHSRLPSHYFTLIQRLEHLNHGLNLIFTGLSTLLQPIGLAVILSMVYHREIISVPLALWLAITISLVANAGLTIFLNHHLMSISLKDIIGASLAQKALSFTVMVGSLKGLFTDHFTWHRTDKFKAAPSGIRALHSARAETLLGLTGIGVAAVTITLLPYHGLLLMLVLGVLYKSIELLAAPLLAIIAERELNKRTL